MDVLDKDIPNKEKLPIKQRYIYSCGKTDGELENKSEIILNRKTYRNAPLLNFTIKLLYKTWQDFLDIQCSLAST